MANAVDKLIELESKEDVQKKAIVFDIDETILDNRPHYRDECAHAACKYDGPKYETWVKQESAPALEPIVKLAQKAKKAGYHVFLITGRVEDWRPATETNLKKVGIAYDGLCMRKDNDKERNIQVIKTEWRELINRMGYTIIANVGDQRSDLRGGFAKNSYQVPNKMYVIPGLCPQCKPVAQFVY